MAFDAGMLSFVLKEINDNLSDGKIEKIYQPAKDEVILLFRARGESKRLLINAGAACPRISITQIKSENPKTAPMFCMMLRKHLSGARLISAMQIGFERAARLTFEGYDELGFKVEKHLIYELMGTYSNIILTDEKDKICGLLRQIDFSSSTRQLLPGMIYQNPPAQNKKDPLVCDERELSELASQCESDRKAEKFIMNNFFGVSPLIAREIAFLSGGAVDATMHDCERNLKKHFFQYVNTIKNASGSPYLVLNPDGTIREFSFMEIGQYGCENEIMPSFGDLIDTFYERKSREEKTRQRATDVLRIVANAGDRAKRKLEARKAELAACDMGDEYKKAADLITANIYMLKRGMTKAKVYDYDTEEEITVDLDSRLTPAANAQKLYKKYAKTKSAKQHLTGLIESAENEIKYIETVADTLTRADTEKEMTEIRSELYHSGYASKMKGYTEKKQTTPTYMTFRTSGGYTVYCGKNNLANEYLTFKRAEKNDWWFHAKNMPGSHVIMTVSGKDEPSPNDFTEAATIAAVYSKAGEGASVDIDYTLVRHIKKPPEAKPGFVIYHTNWSATVIADKKLVQNLQI